MATPPETHPFEASRDDVVLSGDAGGAGPAIVLLHGLTATRRYVVMGSRLLERRGYRLIGFDARGHGQSTPAPEPAAYEYADMVEDLEAVLDHLEIERAVLAGSSMGAATAVAFALAHPERVAGLVQSTPAYGGEPHADEDDLASWARLASGLERDGADGFLAVYHPGVADRWREPLARLTRQRLERHRHPGAVADAMRVVPRSEAFPGLEELAGVEAPTLVVGSRDEADPEHRLEVAEAYAERLPNAELAVEEPGKSPLAWRGSQLSRKIDDFLRRRAPEFAPG
jgi:3-oxoadipate enol-lactonase